jgi:hypothetical protein
MDGESPIENRVQISFLSWAWPKRSMVEGRQVFDECGLKIRDILVVK